MTLLVTLTTDNDEDGDNTHLQTHYTIVRYSVIQTAKRSHHTYIQNNVRRKMFVTRTFHKLLSNCEHFATLVHNLL